MNRRRFITLLAKSAVALAVPIGAIRFAGLGHAVSFEALSYLRREFNTHLSQRGLKVPAKMIASRRLFDAAKYEMQDTRGGLFVWSGLEGVDHFLFKGVPLVRGDFDGWQVKFVERVS